MIRACRTLLLAALVAMSAPAFAQAPLPANTEMRMINTSNDVLPFIDAGTQEILVSAYMLRVQGIAEALRRAMVERGAAVYILTTPEGLNENASYAKSLALAGANVRSGYANAELLIVDRTYVINGPLIGVQAMPEGMDPTFVMTGQEYANNLVTIFIEFFNTSEVFDPTEIRQ